MAKNKQDKKQDTHVTMVNEDGKEANVHVDMVSDYAKGGYREVSEEKEE